MNYIYEYITWIVWEGWLYDFPCQESGQVICCLLLNIPWMQPPQWAPRELTMTPFQPPQIQLPKMNERCGRRHVARCQTGSFKKREIPNLLTLALWRGHASQWRIIMLRSGVKKEEKHGNSAAFLIGVRTKRNLRNLRRGSEKRVSRG